MGRAPDAAFDDQMIAPGSESDLAQPSELFGASADGSIHAMLTALPSHFAEALEASDTPDADFVYQTLMHDMWMKAERRTRVTRSWLVELEDIPTPSSPRFAKMLEDLKQQIVKLLVPLVEHESHIHANKLETPSGRTHSALVDTSKACAVVLGQRWLSVKEDVDMLTGRVAGTDGEAAIGEGLEVFEEEVEEVDDEEEQEEEQEVEEEADEEEEREARNNGLVDEGLAEPQAEVPEEQTVAPVAGNTDKLTAYRATLSTAAAQISSAYSTAASSVQAAHAASAATTVATRVGQRRAEQRAKLVEAKVEAELEKELLRIQKKYDAPIREAQRELLARDVAAAKAAEKLAEKKTTGCRSEAASKEN
jgi:hypothetical protein